MQWQYFLTPCGTTAMRVRLLEQFRILTSKAMRYVQEEQRVGEWMHSQLALAEKDRI